MSFDELLAAVRSRILRHGEGSEVNGVLGLAAAEDARNLFLATKPNDPNNPSADEYHRFQTVAGWLALFYYARHLSRHADDNKALVAALSFAPAFSSTQEAFAALLPQQLGTVLTQHGVRLLQTVQGAELDRLDAAVHCLHDAVNLTPGKHPARPSRLALLGYAHRLRFDRTGALADLDAAIAARREAVDTAAPGDPNRGGYLVDLAAAHYARHERTGTLADLYAAVEAGCQAIDAIQPGTAGHALALSNLAGAHRALFEQTGALSDLSAAVDYMTRSVDSTPKDDPDLAGRLSNLGFVHLTRYARTGLATDLGTAIDAGRRSVEGRSADDPSRGRYLANLSLAYRTRYERHGEWSDLEAAVTTARQAVEATAADPGDRALSMFALGRAYLERYQRTGELGELDAAIEAAGQAQDAVPPDHLERSRYLADLALAYRVRYERTRRPDDLRAALKAGQAAVSLTPRENADWARRAYGLGVAHRLEYERAGAMPDLTAAIGAAQAVLDVTPDRHPNRASALGTLGLIHQARHRRTGSPADLDAAVAAGQQAVAAVEPGHPERPIHLLNLAAAHTARYEAAAQTTDLDAAVDLLQLAVDDELILPTPRIRALRTQGWLLWTGRRDVARAAARYREAVERLATEVAPRNLHLSDQEQLLGGHFGLVSDAVSAQLDNRDLTAAVELAELGRGILLAQGLDSRSDLTELRRLAPDLAEDFEQSLADLEPTADEGVTIGISHPELDRGQADRRRAAAARFDRLLTLIRSLPGMRSFLARPNIRDLTDRAAAGGPVVLVNVGSRRADAIVLRAGTDPQCIELSDLTVLDVLDRYVELLHAPDDPGDYGSHTVASILEWLWRSTVGPVLEHLRYTTNLPDTAQGPRLCWVPTGLLAALPLHAAGLPGGPSALDRVVSSYAPTIRALAAQTRRPAPTPRLLVAEMPTTPALPHRPGAPDLPGTTDEASALVHRYPADPPLRAEGATVGNVLARLAKATWAHFACHAVTDPTAPSRGRLLLYDGDLDIPRISRLRLDHAELAYLSACATTSGGVRQADEVITVASAFQLAGFRHVIGTLWSVDDRIAAAAARAFYTALPETNSVDTAAAALRQVTRQLCATHPNDPLTWAQFIHIGP
jgi:tetratricopeptide (TPR) repeat protein